MPKYKQQANGTYKAKVWDGTYLDGKKHYKYIYSTKSSRDLEIKVKEFEDYVEQGFATNRSFVSIQDYARQWLKNYKSFKEKNTLAMYNNIIEVHLHRFAHSTFDAFTLSNIQGLINDTAGKPRTCQQIRMTLKQIGESAELDKYLQRGKTEEIFSRVTLPKYKATEKRPLYDHEKDAVRNALLSPRERLFVSVLYYTGLRREEALALTYGDIQGGYVTVNKAIGFEKNAPYTKSTKTERSNRKVPIPPQLQSVFDEHLPAAAPSTQIFTQLNGKPMTASSYRKMWESIQQKTGIDATAHIFRHNYCTQLCYVAATKHTITTKKIAELLGDTEKMVLEVYSHVIEEKEKTEESIIEAVNL